MQKHKIHKIENVQNKITNIIRILTKLNQSNQKITIKAKIMIQRTVENLLTATQI